MIERLRIENFKVFKDVEFPLQPLTVIVGPNASGKSSILQAIEWWANKVTGVERPAEGKPRVGTGGSLRVVVQWDGSDAFVAELRRESRMKLDLKCVRVVFEPGRLAAPVYSQELRPRLSPSGDGLAGAIAILKLEHSEQFERIVQDLKTVVETVKDIRIRPAHVDLAEPEEAMVKGRLEQVHVVRVYTGFEILFDMEGADGIPAKEISEGTLFTLGLLTLLNYPSPPTLFLIDDIERGLHPRAMGELIVQLRRLQGERPELQIVATSHSPLLADYLKPEEVLLTALNPDGSASVAPLTDHPDFERWKDVMEPGEFWSTVGEKWITDRLPAEKP